MSGDEERQTRNNPADSKTISIIEIKDFSKTFLGDETRHQLNISFTAFQPNSFRFAPALHFVHTHTQTTLQLRLYDG